MKRKIIYLSIPILLVVGLILKINTKEKAYLNKEAIENNKSIAVYIEQEDGTYNKTTTIPNKEDNYVLNTNKSICNGNTTIGWNKEEWGIELNNIDREETKCYLYFNKGKTIEEIIPTLNAKTETPNFSTIATTDEGVYKVEDGMYGGTSYYWRGAVTNNYVKFGEFCWRIVRINGDGSLRLIYDGATCHANGTSTVESIAVQNVAYNTKTSRSEYVGWSYVEGKQRPETGDIPIDSNAKIETEKWYNNNIRNNNSYDSKVADGKFCNDRNTASGYSWSSQPVNTLHYVGYDRSGAENASNVKPTLNCPLGDTYALKVGTITMDEVIMAGAKWGANNANSEYYLYNGRLYWTMTPYGRSGGSTAVFRVDSTGFLGIWDVDGTYDVRPVINLRSDVIFSSGNGTLNNPYVVQ